MFWGGLGYFEAVGFQKRNLAHYMYGDGLLVFGVFWVGLGYFEAVGFQKRNLAHYMYGVCRLVPHVDKAPLPLRILRLVTSNFLPVENPTHPTAHAPERASVYILGQFRTSK